MSRPHPPAEARVVLGYDATERPMMLVGAVFMTVWVGYAVVGGFVTHDYLMVLGGLVGGALALTFWAFSRGSQVRWVAATRDRLVWWDGWGPVNEAPLSQVRLLSRSLLSNQLEIELADGTVLVSRWVPWADELGRLVRAANPQVQDLL